ncbi:response regulator, partial [Candidatus Hydrogenedentota bacterium]
SQNCKSGAKFPPHSTTFKVYLPAVETASGRDFFKTPDESVRGTGHVLIVDDEETIRKMAVEMLRTLGYETTTCKDGAEAVEYYRKSWREIDLVILDMVMPELSGRDTFIVMREINPKVKAILASGYSVNGEAQEILDDGALSFVQKPFQRAELSHEVARALGA